MNSLIVLTLRVGKYVAATLNSIPDAMYYILLPIKYVKNSKVVNL